MRISSKVDIEYSIQRSRAGSFSAQEIVQCYFPGETKTGCVIIKDIFEAMGVEWRRGRGILLLEFIQKRKGEGR